MSLLSKNDILMPTSGCVTCKFLHTTPMRRASSGGNSKKCWVDVFHPDNLAIEDVFMQCLGWQFCDERYWLVYRLYLLSLLHLVRWKMCPQKIHRSLIFVPPFHVNALDESTPEERLVWGGFYNLFLNYTQHGREWMILLKTCRWWHFLYHCVCLMV